MLLLLLLLQCERFEGAVAGQRGSVVHSEGEFTVIVSPMKLLVGKKQSLIVISFFLYLILYISRFLPFYPEL